MSYLTPAEAQEYFDARIGADAWEEASETDQDKALKHASRVIDRLNYIGSKAVATQERQFPRGTDTLVPKAIKDATCEVALSLLDGVDPNMEYENISMNSQGYGNVRSNYDRTHVPPHIVSGIPSFIAWTYLQPYLRDPYSFDIHRTS